MGEEENQRRGSRSYSTASQETYQAVTGDCWIYPQPQTLFNSSNSLSLCFQGTKIVSVDEVLCWLLKHSYIIDDIILLLSVTRELDSLGTCQIGN